MAGTWIKVWDEETNIIDPNFDGTQEGEEDYTHTFTLNNLPSGNLTFQVDAEYREYADDEEVTREVLTAPRSSTSVVTNLPWETGNIMYGTLYAPVRNGNNLSITGYAYNYDMWGALRKGYFVIKAIYYYQEDTTTEPEPEPDSPWIKVWDKVTS